MDNIRALRIAIGCVMASGMDSETKNEVITKLLEIEELIEHEEPLNTHGLCIGDLVRVTELDGLDRIIGLNAGEIARITDFHEDGSGVIVFFEHTIGDYSLSFDQFEKVEVK